MTNPIPPIPPLNGPAWGPLKPGPARHLVVLLHGLGADGSDLIDLAPHWAAAAAHARFVAPDAPFPCDMAPYGRQWYSLQDRSPPVILAGAERAAPALNTFIDAELRSLGLTPDRLVLMGFSQGTMMALHVAPRRAEPVAGVMGFSGRLVAPERLAAETVSRPPILLIHGEADGVVPVAETRAAARTLAAAGFTVESHYRPDLDHGIDGDGVALAGQFLARVLGGETD